MFIFIYVVQEKNVKEYGRKQDMGWWLMEAGWQLMSSSIVQVNEGVYCAHTRRN